MARRLDVRLHRRKERTVLKHSDGVALMHCTVSKSCERAQAFLQRRQASRSSSRYGV